MSQEPRLFLEPLDSRDRERLRALVDAFKGGNALAPVSVIVPSTYAGLDLRHDRSRHGRANVQFLVLARLAELLGSPSLAAQGRPPLTPLVEAAAVRAVASEARGPLVTMRQHPALHHTLRSTFRELRHAVEQGLTALAAQGELRDEVVSLYQLFRERTDPHYYDRETLAESAARAVRDGVASGLKDLGPVVFFLVSDLTPGEQALVEALEEHWSCAMILGLAGDAIADGPVSALGDRTYENLRETWERAVEEILLNGTVLRFGDSVQTSRLAKLTDVTEVDIETVTREMSRCSDYVHDEAGVLHTDVPDPDIVEGDINRLADWVRGLRRDRGRS